MAQNDNAGCVRAHTRARGIRTAAHARRRAPAAPGATSARWTRPAARAALTAVAVLASAACAHAQDFHEIRARVIWTREPSVYVAADSGVLAPGMALRFQRGKRQLGSGSVERLLEPGLAVARLHEGSLAREKRLDKLRVFAGAAVAPPHGTLRVGLPAPTRRHLLFACSSPHWGGERPAGSPPDTLGRGIVALRRETGTPGNAAGPETLLVRFFADAADQEIALERGDLDVAVFWPGELSPRMRADARWHEPSLARRTRGVLACTGASPDSLEPDPAALATLQHDVFAGDLEPLPAPPRAGAAPVRLARVEPDPSLPGAAALSRALARNGTSGPALRLVHLPDADPASPPPGVRAVFALRCAVLTAPALRAEWPAQAGAAELANLLQCGAAR